VQAVSSTASSIIYVILSEAKNLSSISARQKEREILRFAQNDNEISFALLNMTKTILRGGTRGVRYLRAGFAESGILKIISPGRASPISSRAMRSMDFGSDFSEPT